MANACRRRLSRSTMTSSRHALPAGRSPRTSSAPSSVQRASVITTPGPGTGRLRPRLVTFSVSSPSSDSPACSRWSPAIGTVAAGTGRGVSTANRVRRRRNPPATSDTYTSHLPSAGRPSRFRSPGSSVASNPVHERSQSDWRPFAVTSGRCVFFERSRTAEVRSRTGRKRPGRMAETVRRCAPSLAAPMPVM